MKKLFYLWIGTIILFSNQLIAHGLIEKPASREQFCGVETKPHDIYSKLLHEECRPILTKADGSLDNSIYNFMAVLTHTIGRQGRTVTNLPKNVCGFDAEPWGGGQTPWDKANNWPVNVLTTGKNQFVWNISWGNHFSDTEEFAYWITKSDFVFDPNKELTWNDFEEKPFCLLKYDDKNPSANPNIVPDKINNKFTTTCTVPARSKRAVIYGEWGRNSSTFERFHSCIDVAFSDSPTPSPIKAIISPLPSQVLGATELTLNASTSQGNPSIYQWTISTNDPNYYTIADATKPITKLTIKNSAAEQRVVVNLTVKNSEFSDETSTSFIHSPASLDIWKHLGTALTDNTLKEGDKIYLRVIDTAGKDYYLPNTPLVLNAENAKAENWGYYLAQAVQKNTFSLSIGVLNASTQTVTPVRSATENKIYVPTNSVLANAYVVVERNQTPTTTCRVEKRSGASAYWMGYNIYASTAPILLDFSNTGIDLSKVSIDTSAFSNIKILSSTQLLINAKQSWVSSTTAGYMGFMASNYPPLSSSPAALCNAG